VGSRLRVGLHPQEDVAKIDLGVDSMSLAGGYEGVQAGQVLAGLFVANEEEVLASEGGDAQCPFAGAMPRPRLCRVPPPPERVARLSMFTCAA